MKKTVQMFLTTLSLICGLCACGSPDPGSSVSGTGSERTDGEGMSGSQNGGNSSGSSAGVASSGTVPAGTMDSRTGSAASASGLRFLCEDDGKANCSNKEGYYYLDQNSIRLSDGSCGSRLMYMDYASCREVYLCSSPGCSHDTPDCTAVLPDDEFPPYTVRIFLYQGFLYVLSRRHDPGGGTVTVPYGSDAGSFFVSSDEVDTLAVLYRMNPDGTGRQKVYTFDSGLTLEGTLAISDTGLFCIARKLSAEETGTGGYASSSERKLLCLNLTSLDAEEICSLDFGDGVRWRMMGCAGDAIVLRGTDYGRQLTQEEYDNNDAYHKYFENSSEVFVALDIADPVPREFYRMSNKVLRSVAVLGGCLYVGPEGSNEIIGVDAATGEQRTVCTLSQNNIWGTVGNMLYCREWYSQTAQADYTYYFVNVNTGEIHHSGLVNKSLGWSLDIKAETESDVLVVYDYDAAPSRLNDGGYEIRLYQHGLISKEDLYAGKDHYRKIQMVGKGE